MKPGYIVALVVLVVAMCAAIYSFSGVVAQHADISTAISQPGKTLQIPGRIRKETVKYEITEGRGSLRFTIEDFVDPSKTIQVVYAKPKPENFDAAVSVEAIGEYREGVFEAHNLLVKCPSKYNDQSSAAK
ncbi:MAG: cytochrome c maturation protein CcmE [Armatimonadetes bacterium]|nr:cytochrome c maturation protein CcmE [Armatimonadota bacterium]